MIALLALLQAAPAVAQVIVSGGRQGPPPPAVSVVITAPTSGTTHDAGSDATLTTLAGTAVNNRGVGINACTWANSLTGGSGAATGTAAWSVSSIALDVGSNPVTVTCTDNAGTQGADLLTVTRSGGGDLSCDDSSATTTSAGLNTFLDSITTGGASANDPRVLCLTATTITLTSQVDWTVPNHVVLLGNGGLTTMGGDDGSTTTLVDNFGSGTTTIAFTSIDGYFRMAGFTYDGPNNAGIKEGGVIAFGGDSNQFRLDHFTYAAIGASDQNKWLYISGCLYGVIDHAIFNLDNDLAWIHAVNGSCTGNGRGNEVWADPTGFGGADFIFLEDSQWLADGDAVVSDTTVFDCHTGGKIVVRFTTVTAASIAQTHSTGHSGEDRGCRAYELYGNTQDLATAGDDPSFCLSCTNSGPNLTWGNDSDGATERYLYFNSIRAEGASGCGGGGTYCQGATPDDHGYCGTDFNGTGSAWDGNTVAATGYPCLDDPARGVGDLLDGLFPNLENTTTGTIAWPNQALEPIYEWLNVGNPTGTYVSNFSGTGRMLQNRDFYLYRGNSSCNQGAGSCTAGVGSGTLAQRPANCTAGVAWWATDQGSWNSSSSNPEGVDQSGADGVLYKCTSMNNWEPYYTPYAYPHPLQSTP